MQGFYPSNLPKEYQGILPYAYGTQDPSVVATPGTQGQFFLRLPNGNFYQKNDNGLSTNWTLRTFGGSLPVIPNFYEVFVGGTYPTIQSAIDQAVLDGASSTNPMIVLVYPRSGGWTENLNLASFVFVVGAGSGEQRATRITGQHNYTTNSGAIAQNTSRISNCELIGSAGQTVISHLGTAPSRLYVDKCFIGSGSVLNCILVNNSGTNSLCEVTNCVLSVGGAGTRCVDVQAGRFYAHTFNDFTGRTQCVRSSAGTSTTLVDTALSAVGNNVCEFSGNAQIAVCNITNTQANSDGISLLGLAQATVGNSFYNVPVGTGFAVRGVLGCAYINAQNVYALNNRVSNAMGAGVVNLNTTYVLA